MQKSIKEKCGMFIKKPVTCLDSQNLFIHSGITVVGSFAGIGKTSWLHSKSEQWRSEGYEVLHFNCDCSPCYDKEMYNSPTTKEEFDELLKMMLDTADAKDIFIFDSLKALCSYIDKDTESNTDMMWLLLEFRNIALKTGCSIILVHHVYKNKQVKSAETHLSGSRALEEQSDSSFIFNRKDSELSAQIVKSRAGLSRDSQILIV